MPPRSRAAWTSNSVPSLRVDGTVEGFHPADSADAHPCCFRKLRLVPSQQDAGCPQLSSIREFQERTVTGSHLEAETVSHCPDLAGLRMLRIAERKL
jgi:hypothetical protein